MDFLWSPWRYQYIAAENRTPGCPFCVLPQKDSDQETFILHRAKYCFVILNIFPYISGHLMIVPYEHTSNLLDLSKSATDEMMDLTRKSYQALVQEYKPQGCNVGMNLGKAAGAGIEEHLHMHVLPRWLGDVNFMTTIGEVRVIPENLEVTYSRLLPYFA